MGPEANLRTNENSGRKSVEEPNADRLLAAYEVQVTNPEQAIQEFKILADIGSPMAPLYLGWIYQSGKAVRKDDAEAERWFKLAAERGQALASYYLGHHYLKMARHADAVAAFEQGSTLDCMSSKYCLAMTILDGQANTTNIEKATRLLVAASAQGHVFAMRRLASMYFSGKFGLFGRLHGVALWGKAVMSGLYYAAKAPDDERLRA
jgi:TPR repeat protein